MSEQRRNVAVGLTVIGALVLLGAMIVIFAGVPQMFQGGYELRLLFDSTHDAHEGDAVHLRGCRVGRIVRIDFTEGDPRKGVTITARIDGDVNLPGDTKAYIFSKGVTGGGYLELKPEGEARIDPRTGQPVEFLPKDGSVVIKGAHRGTGLLPGDLLEKAKHALDGLEELAAVLKPALRDFGALSRNLNELVGPPTPTTAPAAPQEHEGLPLATAPAPKGLRATLAKLEAALDAVSAVLGSTDNQANLKTSLDNLARASEKSAEAMTALKAFAEKARTAVDDVAKPASAAAERLMGSAEKLSATLVTINQAARKVAAGEGTVGRLLNNPKLYNNLVEATEQMGELVQELRDFVRIWKERGIPIQLK